MAPGYDGQDRARFAALTQLAAQLRIPTLASALPLMHHGARRKLADVLTAIRLGKRIDALGLDAAPHGENRLRSTAEMLRLFRGYEGAVHRAGTLEKHSVRMIGAKPEAIEKGEDRLLFVFNLTREAMTSGTVDIVVGTHALLANLAAVH